jgi:hypothetical protein
MLWPAVAVLAVAVLVDRWVFAGLTQWREDQSTNLWLGYMLPTQFPGVGLVSSLNIFNPNGLPLLGYVLSFLPNLLWISFVLGLIQVAAVVVLFRSLLQRLPNLQWAVLGTLAVTLSSPGLRATSGEFWNQWLFTTPDLVMAWVLVTMDRPRRWRILLFVIILILIPGFYLAGPITAGAFVLLFCARLLLLYRSDRAAARQVVSWLQSPAVLVPAVLVGCASAWLTWMPYFEAVNFAVFAGGSQGRGELTRRLGHAVLSVACFPHTLIKLSTADLIILLGSEDITGPVAAGALKLTRWLYVAQAVVAVGVVAAAVLQQGRQVFRRLAAGGGIAVGLLILIPLAAAMVSALLNGPRYHLGARLDQQIQFLPFCFIFSFLLPVCLLDGPSQLHRVLRGLVLVMMGTTTVVATVAGVQTCRDHLSYQGPVISDADVPLFHKRAVVDFIAQDWKRRHLPGPLPVDYDLAGPWDWVPEYGEKLAGLYGAPMTIGRSFDFEFRRVHGLVNHQEGVQRREVGTGRYIVSYAGVRLPAAADKTWTHRNFGRLRVSVAEDRPGEGKVSRRDVEPKL